MAIETTPLLSLKAKTTATFPQTCDARGSFSGVKRMKKYISHFWYAGGVKEFDTETGSVSIETRNMRL